MSSPAAAFHAAQDAALRASSALATAMGVAAVPLVEVQPNQVPPYVVGGQYQVILENTDCAAQAEIYSTVTWWSRTAARDHGAQARAMGAAIVAALNAELSVAGWYVVVWELQSEDYVTQADQSTRGRAVFHYLLSQTITG